MPNNEEEGTQICKFSICFIQRRKNLQYNALSGFSRGKQSIQINSHLIPHKAKVTCIRLSSACTTHIASWWYTTRASTRICFNSTAYYCHESQKQKRKINWDFQEQQSEVPATGRCTLTLKPGKKRRLHQEPSWDFAFCDWKYLEATATDATVIEKRGLTKLGVKLLWSDGMEKERRERIECQASEPRG